MSEGGRQAPRDLKPHHPFEDILAFTASTLLVAFGTLLYKKADLVMGGTPGLTLLICHMTGVSFPVVFSLLNLTFLTLAMKQLGRAFSLRTLFAVLGVSLLSKLSDTWIGFSTLDPAYASILGSTLVGIGLLILLRHRASLGGTTIIAVCLQQRWGIRVGRTLMLSDLAILAMSFMFIPIDHLALSAVGTLHINLIIYLNHQVGRYASDM